MHKQHAIIFNNMLTILLRSSHFRQMFSCFVTPTPSSTITPSPTPNPNAGAYSSTGYGLEEATSSSSTNVGGVVTGGV